jgi:micrococcal nuclease
MRNNTTSIQRLIFILGFALWCGIGIGQSTFYKVKSVVDGDTFWVYDGTPKGLKVRLIGINSPETRNTGRTQVEYFGKEAKAYLTRMIAGKSVRLVYDVTKLDRYGRTLAYAYLENGTFINSEMIRQGYAQVMTIPPNVRYADLFVRLQAEARNNNRGLWK